MTTLFSQFKKSDRGFAMLFTVMLVGIILAIALGIAQITFKQTILSNLASDSQISFYQADTGMECGMLYDYKPVAGIPTPPVAGASILCGKTLLRYDGKPTAGNPAIGGTSYQFIPDGFGATTPACFTVTFTKGPTANLIESRGYNNCNPKSPRQVERALRVVY